VVLPRDGAVLAALDGVRDSKQLSPSRREVLKRAIEAVALAVGVGRGERTEIDALGIVPATRLAMQRALQALAVAPQALVIDALTLPDVALPQDAFPYADARSLSVAAAGIVAKVSRDRWMVDVADVAHPGYGFAQHKGYGTRQHRVALDRLGVCAIHRTSFRPIAARVAGE
jgi:ribonuclease HII